jgi:hypothetical protein
MLDRYSNSVRGTMSLHITVSISRYHRKIAQYPTRLSVNLRGKQVMASFPPSNLCTFRSTRWTSARAAVKPACIDPLRPMYVVTISTVRSAFAWSS